jgi:hypothetical protein
MAEAAVVLGEFLQKGGFTVGEHPHFGSVSPRPSNPDSLHFDNRAIDVNHDPDEAGPLNKLYDALAAKAKELGIVELFYGSRGIPTPVADHEDHLHIGFDSREATPGLLAFVHGKNVGGATGILGAGADTVLGGADEGLDALTGLPGQIASALVGGLFDAIGEAGARILLYIALVGGGAGLFYLGLARAMGLRADTVRDVARDAAEIATTKKAPASSPARTPKGAPTA